MNGLVYNIQHYSIHDGPGIRTTVFLKGCPLRCWWCHNPESQEMTVEQITIQRQLDGKVFERKSVVGSQLPADKVMLEIEKDKVFYDQSGGGVTFSGGEPMVQADFIAELLRLCQQRGIHTAIDTCGHAEQASFEKIMGLADLFLYDIKLMDDSRHMQYTGVSNKLALNNLEMLAKNGQDIIVRFPVVPGITDDDENLSGILVLMDRLHLDNIHLLPYHSIARDKYRRMGTEYMLSDLAEPSPEDMSRIKKYFTSKHLATNSMFINPAQGG